MLLGGWSTAAGFGGAGGWSTAAGFGGAAAFPPRCRAQEITTTLATSQGDG